jgi:hypothetical protein
MLNALGILVLLALAGCASAPHVDAAASGCAAAESSYACQAVRYHRASGPP